MVLLGMGAAVASVEVSRLLLGCWELFTSQGNIHHHSIIPLATVHQAVKCPYSLGIPCTLQTWWATSVSLRLGNRG